jgi:hypothetical protein
MTALLNEFPNNVWLRVAIALTNANEYSKRVMNDLRLFLATQAFNPSLQFLTFTDAQLTTAGGIQLGTGTPRLYAVWIKKTGTAGVGTATKSYVKFEDDATDDTTASTQRLVLPLLAKDEEVIYTSPTAIAFANGLNANADTTVLGTTDSTAGDAGFGFAIVG